MSQFTHGFAGNGETDYMFAGPNAGSSLTREEAQNRREIRIESAHFHPRVSLACNWLRKQLVLPRHQLNSLTTNAIGS